MYRFSHTVRLSDTDATGQTYYARPLEWMEWCRVEWFEKHFGNFMQYVAQMGITFFPAKVNIEYKKPTFFGDGLVIEMRAKEIKKVSFGLEFIILRGTEAVMAAEIIMVCFHRQNQRLSALTPPMLSVLRQLNEEVENPGGTREPVLCQS